MTLRQASHKLGSLLVFAAAGGVFGCAPSLFAREATMAKQAEARDDAAGALEHWAKACLADPTEKEACQKESVWAEKLRTRSLKAAKAPCTTGDLEACIAALRDLGRLRPGETEAAALRKTAAVARRQACADLEKPASLDSVLERASCVYKNADLLNEAGQRDLVLEERRHAAAQLVASASGAPAASYVLLQTAHCLSPEVERGKALGVAASFLGEAALPLFATAESVGGREIPQATLSSTCASVTAEVGQSVRCVDSPSAVAPDLTLKVSLTLGRVSHTKIAESLVAKYVSGTERVVNPDRAPAERELDRAKRSFDAIEVEARDRQTRCQQSKIRGACDGYNSIQSTYNTRQDEYVRAKSRLDNTPPYFDRDVVETVPYTVWHHRFSVPYTVVASTAAGVRANDQGVLVRESKEQPGIAPAGVRPIALVTPTDEEFDVEISRVAARVVGVELRRAVATRAVCLGKPWSFDSADLACRSTSELYATGRLPDPRAFLRWLTC